MASIIANGKQQYFNNAGDFLNGGKLYTYIAGTSTPKATYSDAAGTVPNTNPIILDTRGEALIYWAGSYKAVLTDSLGNIIWTVDNIVETNLDYRTSLHGSIVTPVGTTAQRDAPPINGYFRYNSDLAAFEGYYAAAWKSFANAVNGIQVPDGGNILLKTVGGVSIVGAGDVGFKTVGGNNIIGVGDIATGNINTVTNPTSSVTLTSATIGYHATAMTAIGQALTAPDARTITVGGPRAVIDNTKGTYPVGWRDNTGALVMAVAAGGIGYVGLKDNSTQAGVWSVVGSNLEPGLATIDSTFSSTYGSTVFAPFIAIDANTSMHFAPLVANGFAAFLCDNTGKVISAPVAIDTRAGAVPLQVFKVTATQVVVFEGPAGTADTLLLNITGASPTLGISIATNATGPFPIDTPYGGENFTGPPRMVQLAANLYGCSYTNGVNTAVAALQITGNTLTWGAGVNIITVNSVANSNYSYPLTALTFFAGYKSGAAAPYANNGAVISVTNAVPPVCTVNAPAALTGCGSSNTSPPASCQLSSGKVIVADDNNINTQVVSNIFSIVTTTTAAGTVVSVETGITAGSLASYTGNNATRYNPHLSPCAATTALLWYLDGTASSRTVVLTDTANVMSKGSIIYRNLSTASSATEDYGVILPQGTVEFVGLRQSGVAGAWKLKLNPNKITGNVITSGAGYTQATIGIGTDASQMAMTKLSSGDYIIPGSTAGASRGSTGVSIFRSNGDAINFRGVVSCPPISDLSNATITVSSNRIVILGSTRTSGSNISAATFNLRCINMEIAA